jgi:hypothetical protein
MRVLCPLLLVLGALCCATLALAAPNITVTPTTWSPPNIDATWLAGGIIGSVAGNAGSNLTATYQTPTNVVTLRINPLLSGSGTCKVWRVDTSWWTGGTIKVQCAAKSTGWVTVGTAASPANFFNYSNGLLGVNYLCQIELNGVAYSVAAASYTTTLTFGVG